MTADKLIACTRRLHLIQAIYLTFQPGLSGIIGLRRLIALQRSNSLVKIDPGIMIGLLAVNLSGEWDRVSRTVPVYGMMHVENDVLTAIAPDLENVSTGDHIASKLFTSSQKKQDQAFQELIKSIASQLFVGHIRDWGCLIAFDLVEFEDLPGLQFTITNAGDQTKIVEVILDGFSGRMAVDGKFGNTRCSHPDQIRKVIVDALAEKLEGMTATA